MLRRVVITGLGAVSPNGIGLKNFWENTCKGISGVNRIASFDASELICQIAGEASQFDPSLYYSTADLKKLISDKTIIIIENHYLNSIIDKMQFDTFYHEHPRTYSLNSFILPYYP